MKYFFLKNRGFINFRIITISFDESKESFLEEELNKFTGNRKILNYKAELFSPYRSSDLQGE